MGSTATDSSLRRNRRLKWLGAAALASVLLTVAAWQTRERWLAGMIHAWAVNDPVERVDAIVVLGGGSQYRTFAAARLFKDGQTTRVLYPDIALSVEDVSAGRTVSPETELIGRVLEHEGVPRSAYEIIGRAVNSTQDEITAVRAWAEQQHARTILAPTALITPAASAGSGTSCSTARSPGCSSQWWTRRVTAGRNGGGTSAASRRSSQS